ncbi:MAG: GTP-binding protein [Chloroflexota bacterium]
MYINWPRRELNLKIVYYGPSLSGKTTNLEMIYQKVDPQRRSELVSLKTHEDRTLFFDFLQLELGKIGTLTPKIHLYTVPGQSYYESSRKIVLKGADGVVFVADSASSRIEDNLMSWRDMIKHLQAMQISALSLPLVIQFNKQDLPDALSPSVLRSVMRVNGHPTLGAVAIRGEGVFDTLRAITTAVMSAIQKQMS